MSKSWKSQGYKLFPENNQPFGSDLVARNIQRGRDHSLPGYVEFWKAFGRQPGDPNDITCWSHKPSAISQNNWDRLRDLYRDPRQIDLFVGGLAEIPNKGAAVGPTFGCLLGRQMYYYKRGDRYWYENDIPPSSFTKDQLNEIRKISLGSVICDNSESIDFVQPNVFIEADPFLNALMSCDGSTLIKKMNLNKWATASPRYKN